MNKEYAGVTTLLLTIVFVVSALGIYFKLTMLAWNYLMPMIFGLPELTYWQTIGLVTLIKSTCYSKNIESTKGK